MSKALIQLSFVRAPSSNQIRGMRLKAAIPNDAGRVMRARVVDGEAVSFYATADSAPSFRGQYLIAESSDMSFVNERELTRFLDKLKWQGFDEFEFIGSWNAADLDMDRFRLKMQNNRL